MNVYFSPQQYTLCIYDASPICCLQQLKQNSFYRPHIKLDTVMFELSPSDKDDAIDHIYFNSSMALTVQVERDARRSSEHINPRQPIRVSVHSTNKCDQRLGAFVESRSEAGPLKTPPQSCAGRSNAWSLLRRATIPPTTIAERKTGTKA